MNQVVTLWKKIMSSKYWHIEMSQRSVICRAVLELKSLSRSAPVPDSSGWQLLEFVLCVPRINCITASFNYSGTFIIPWRTWLPFVCKDDCITLFLWIYVNCVLSSIREDIQNPHLYCPFRGGRPMIRSENKGDVKREGRWSSVGRG